MKKWFAVVALTIVVAAVCLGVGSYWEPAQFDVRLFGVIGDGVTDDTTAIQATLDYAHSLGGGIVFFPRGNYIVASFTSYADTVCSFAPGAVLQSSGAASIRIDGKIEAGAYQIFDDSLYETDIITNSEFTSNITGWSGTNWAHSSGTALHTPGSVSPLTLTETITVVSGIEYELTFDVVGGSAGTVKPAFGGNNLTARSYGNNSYLVSSTAIGTTTLTFTPSTDFDGAIDNVHLKPQITNTYGWNSILLPEWFGAIPNDAADDSQAIQAASNTAGAGDIIEFQNAQYDVAIPVQPYSTTYRSTGMRGALIYGTASNTDSIFKYPSLARAEFIGLTFRTGSELCTVFNGYLLTGYTDTCLWRDCSFYCESYRDIYGVLANCVFDRVHFGYDGTINTTYHQAVYSGSSSGVKSSFTNTFRQCWFWKSIGATAAVHFIEGSTLRFESCIWQHCETPAVAAYGIAQTQFVNCNYEDVEPGEIDSDECLVKIGPDPTSAIPGLVVFDNCWFQNNGHSNSNPWVVMAQLTDSGGNAKAYFRNCDGNGGSAYWTRTGSTLDYAPDVDLKDNFVNSMSSSLNQANSENDTIYITDPVAFAITPQSVEPSGVTNGIYLDDGTNTDSGVAEWRRWDGAAWVDIGISPSNEIVSPVDALFIRSMNGVSVDIGNSCAYLPDGWWKLDDDAASTDVVDSSGNSYTMTAQANTDTLNATGVVGGSLTFNGTTDYISRANNTFTDSAGTISAWVKLTTLPASNATILASADEGAGPINKALLFSITSSGHLRIRVHTGSVDTYATGDGVISTGEWYHVAATSDSSAWALYINGETQELTLGGSNTGNWFGDAPNRDNLSLGLLIQSSVAYRLSGELDDVRIYSETLTQTQIEYMANSRAETFAGSLSVNGVPGLNGTEIIDNGTNRVTNVYKGGLLVSKTIAASSSATWTWTAD